MSENDRVRASISATLAEIEAAHKAFAPTDVREPGDREAYDIICRIERKLAQAKDATAA